MQWKASKKNHGPTRHILHTYVFMRTMKHILNFLVHIIQQNGEQC